MSATLAPKTTDRPSATRCPFTPVSLTIHSVNWMVSPIRTKAATPPKIALVISSSKPHSLCLSLHRLHLSWVSPCRALQKADEAFAGPAQAPAHRRCHGSTGRSPTLPSSVPRVRWMHRTKALNCGRC